jgi:hypothetical protein
MLAAAGMQYLHPTEYHVLTSSGTFLKGNKVVSDGIHVGKAWIQRQARPRKSTDGFFIQDVIEWDDRAARATQHESRKDSAVQLVCSCKN